MEEQGVICVFAKPPDSTGAKTRLVPAVGAAGASALAAAFLRDIWAALCLLGWAKPIIASTDASISSIFSSSPEIWLQGDGDLGVRLERILRRALQSAPFAIALGADSPGLPAKFLEEAYAALSQADAVIGPCEDGGFYLLGLRRCPAGLLSGIPWSHRTTLARTLERLKAARLTVRVLDRWFDVDRPEDLTRLAYMITRGEIHATQTETVLNHLQPNQVNAKQAKVSVIIPVLNEHERLPQLLAHLKGHPWIDEVIFGDGGSTDGTIEWLRLQEGVKIVQAPVGRGIQLNRGAQASTGEVLLFLHADTCLPEDGYSCIEQTLARPNVAGGCFCVRFDAQRPRSLGIVAAGINFRTLLTRTGTGDQAIFVRRAVFDEIGGYPEWPLFEDVEFVSRMKRVGKFAVVLSPVTVSARRHVHRGVFRTVILCYLLRLAYWAGISPFTLAKWYEGPSRYVKTQAALPTPPLSSVVSKDDSSILRLRRS